MKTNRLPKNLLRTTALAGSAALALILANCAPASGNFGGGGGGGIVGPEEIAPLTPKPKPPVLGPGVFKPMPPKPPVWGPGVIKPMPPKPKPPVLGPNKLKPIGPGPLPPIGPKKIKMNP